MAHLRLQTALALGIGLAAFGAGLAVAQTIAPQLAFNLGHVEWDRAYFSGAPAKVLWSGSNLRVFAGRVTVHQGGGLSARVHWATAGGGPEDAPPGKYRFKFTFTGVNEDATVTMSGTQQINPSCKLVKKLGLQNKQTCEALINSTGTGPVSAALQLTSGASYLEVDSITVVKEQ